MRPFRCQGDKRSKIKEKITTTLVIPTKEETHNADKTMLENTEGYHTYYVYIITNNYRSTFYIGMTNNLGLRLTQHKENIVNGTKTFASRYFLENLVYYEKFTWVQEAIAREKELKGWRRDKKLALIRSFNKEFEFLDHHFIRPK